jgi:hypothetical protein
MLLIAKYTNKRANSNVELGLSRAVMNFRILLAVVPMALLGCSNEPNSKDVSAAFEKYCIERRAWLFNLSNHLADLTGKNPANVNKELAESCKPA